MKRNIQNLHAKGILPNHSNIKNEVKLTDGIEDESMHGVEYIDECSLDCYSNTPEHTIYENLQVLSSENKNTSPACAYEKNYLEYIDKLEEKVRIQASRLSVLEQMKLNSQNTQNIQNTQRVKGKSPLKTSSYMKIEDKENNVPLEKYEILQSKHVQLLTDYSDLKNKSKSVIKGITRHLFDFPEIDRIQSPEKLKENYSNIRACYKELIVEKEEILEILRNETLTGDEQRNYIQVLQQTIEADLFKSGIISKYINMDKVIDFGQIRSEGERYRKELSHTLNLISNLKSENEELKKTNTSLIKNKDKIRRTLDNGMNEMEVCKEKTKSLENINYGLEDQICLLRESNNKICRERDDLIGKNSIMLNKVKEINKISEDQKEMIIGRLNEYRNNYDKLNSDFENVLKEKTKLEIDNSKLNDEINNLKEHFDENNKNFDEIQSQNKKLNLNNYSDLHSNYRMLYEELSIEFEEYKTSHKKISNSFLKKLKKSYNKSHELMYDEHVALTTESNKLTLEIQKYEMDNETYKKRLEELEEAYNKYLNLYENELKTSKSILLDKNSLQNTVNKFQEEIKFYKEKFDKDMVLKSKEVKSLQEESSLHKTENKKVNELLKDYKQINLEKDDLIEEMTQKVNNYEEILEDYTNKQDQLMELKGQFTNLTKKYNNIIEDLDEFSEKNEKFDKIISELKEEKLNLKEKLDDLEKDYSIIENKNIERLREIENMNCQLTSIESEKNKLLDKIEALSLTIKTGESYIEEREKEIEYLDNGCKSLESQNDYLNQGLNHFKKEYEDASNANKHLQNFIADIKIHLYSLHSHLKVSIHKFNSYANEDLDSLLTKNFSQGLIKLIQGVNSYTTEVNENTILSLSAEYIKILSNEFENCYDKLIDSNNFIREANGKVILLENSINEVSKSQGEYIVREKKYKVLVKNIQNEKSECEVKYKEDNEVNENEINYLKKEREEFFLDYKKQRSEINSLLSRNETLTKDNQKLLNDIDILYENGSKLENKCITIHKEKKYTENLLQSLVKSYPSKEVVRSMNDVISINEFIFKIEGEKMKIEEKLNIMKKESKILSEDKSSLNTDLSQIVKNEQENLKKLIQDYDRKINDKKSVQKNLENEIYSYEDAVKSAYENSMNNQTELKRLQKEFDEYREYVENYNRNNNNNLRNNNTLTGSQSKNNNQNKIIITTPNYQIPNNHVEISCLESNNFSDSNTKFNNKKDTEPILMTNYESIELEYSEDNFKEKKQYAFSTIGKDNIKTRNVPKLNIAMCMNNSSTDNRNTRRDNIDKINTVTVETTLKTSRRNLNLI